MKFLIILILLFPLLSLGQQTVDLNRPISLSLINGIYDTKYEAYHEYRNFTELVGRIYPVRKLVEDPLTGRPLTESGIGDTEEFNYITYVNTGGRGGGDLNDIVAEWFASADTIGDLVTLTQNTLGTDDLNEEIQTLLTIYDLNGLAEAIAEFSRISDSAPEEAKRLARAARTILFAAWSFAGETAEQASGDTKNYVRIYRRTLQKGECIIVLALGSGAIMYENIISSLKNDIQFQGQLSVVYLNRWEFSSIPRIYSDMIGRYIAENGDGELGEALKRAIDSAKNTCGFRIADTLSPLNTINPNGSDGVTFKWSTTWAGKPEFPVRVYGSNDPSCRSADCAFEQTANYDGLFITEQNPLKYTGGCFGTHDSFLFLFGPQLRPNVPQDLSFYTFLEDRRGVVTVPEYIEWTCTYVP